MVVNLRDETGKIVKALPGQAVTATEIRRIMREKPVRFVVVRSSTDYTWIDRFECFEFWKNEVRQHLYHDDAMYCADYPDAYYYLATEWRLNTGERVVVLEMIR